MAERRRYTKRQKVTAISAAMASSVQAASEEQGIPRRTIGYWMESPEFAELRQKTREDLVAELNVLTHLFVQKIIERIDEFKPSDILVGLGIATDKGQLLSGAATSRTESKALSDGLNDHEKRQLRNGLDRLLSEPAQEGAGEPEVRAGAEVRE